ncbi:hypothetical protein O181_020219 [Austropuccinia psidii MF-1]|uniref:Uncharacterized protein n=1 Tax=Austropuccinia psidii MF-1 TaxID=1389203 RepID=A0A9Q3GVH2_9BASI|nr:hypothetical protein [Austropuccinia psidii MF-1]
MICIKEIPFKELMVITKRWNPNRKVTLLEERASKIRENQATIQAMEEKKEPDRAYSDSFRLTRSKKPRLPSGFKPFRKQKISDQESPLFKIPGSF